MRHKRIAHVCVAAVIAFQISMLGYFVTQMMSLVDHRRLVDWDHPGNAPRDVMDKLDAFLNAIRIAHASVGQMGDGNISGLYKALSDTVDTSEAVAKHHTRDPVTIAAGSVSGNRTSAVTVGERAGDRKRVLVWGPSPGRLGNKLFSFASFLGTALVMGMEPQIRMRDCRQLRDTFVVNVTCSAAVDAVSGRYNAHGTASYDSNVRLLYPDPALGPVLLAGYLQSWRYFHPRRRELLQQHLAFRSGVLAKSRDTLDTAVRRQLNVTGSDALRRGNVTLVGIHVRRGDMMGASLMERGYTAAPASYFTAAMRAMEEALRTTSIVYVVASDDMAWCKANLASRRPLLWFTSGRADADLAMLAECDHVIISTGTFGWWGAYLSGGRAVYYSGYPRPGTSLAKLTVPGDYYLPDWIGVP